MIPARIADALTGRCASEAEIALLKERFPPAMVPEWFVTLLREFRLARASLSLAESDDMAGLGAELYWFAPEGMISEAFDYYPGISVLGVGFLPIAGCAMGSGDPYFLDLRVSTVDPPVVRLLHDFAPLDGRAFPEEGIELVSRSLSEFFAKARVG